ncbi:Zn-ribbon-containing protein [Rheinheimera sp. 4Y26]|uniref:Zn-ribbon-containing protein n=1 Tax=Rheinheimera sp. 4Y26 TaxID=2977811 RepID=UPI0021B0FD6B|nr:Zn-ribbon-containing protein [Rheinheimera sp. 4Y26]MCT6700148.1 Zn-ribbon-containing protein [Rheinheimera sp. 4Y26]
MWVAELRFRIIADTSYPAAEAAVRAYLETLIFQGQMLGREFPTYLAQDEFVSRLILPAPDALQKQHHSQRGLAALQALGSAGLAYPQLAMLGEDLMSNHTDPCQTPSAYILYCRFGHSNSVIYCAEHFAPVPLYRLKATSTEDHEDLIRWQLQYQALDEIQMQEKRVLNNTAERSLQSLHSKLNQQGRAFAKQLEQSLQRPVYYALYSGSSKDCSQEADKLCPGCGKAWALKTPLHQLFDFQCDPCRLLSNIAWQCQ